MALEVKLLDLIDIELESSFLVLARNMGEKALAKTWGSLILGGDDPILVDTGASHPEIMQRLGMTGWISEEQKMENQLARYGVSVADLQDSVAAAVGGQKAGTLFQGDRRFDIVVRLPDELRTDIEAIKRLPIALPAPTAGAGAPLAAAP